MDDYHLFYFLSIIIVLLLSINFLIYHCLTIFNWIRLDELHDLNTKNAQLLSNLLDHQHQRLIHTLHAINTMGLIGLVLIISQITSILLSGLLVAAIWLIIFETLMLTVAQTNPEIILCRLYPYIYSVIYVLMAPLFGLFASIKRLFELVIKTEMTEVDTEKELLNLIEEAQNDGELLESESDLIRRSIEFNNRLVSELLTPRVDIIALDSRWSFDKMIQVMNEHGYSRYPVYQDTIDSIIGVIHVKDIWKLDENSFSLYKVLKPVISIFESYPAAKLLKQIQSNKSHLAVVIDAYGGTAGIVTLEDIVEDLVGEIWDEHDDVDHDIIPLSDDQYIVLGSCELAYLSNKLNLDLDLDEIDSTTVGGWVIESIGELPDISQNITINHWQITILDADEKRILKILFKV